MSANLTIVHTDLGAQPFADLTSHDAFCERAALGIALNAVRKLAAELGLAAATASTTDTSQLLESHAGMLRDMVSDYDAQAEKIAEAMRTPLAPRIEDIGRL